jgi:uncharacterized protein (TIGR02996 family)
MSDEKALLAAIWEHPHEDTPRLMYADWLQERGGASNVARAEFIRAQCELARTPHGTPRWTELYARAVRLREAHTGTWKRGVSKGIAYAAYERGFFRPAPRTFTGSQFLALKRGALKEAPAWQVDLKSFVSVFDRVTASSNLARVGWLYLHRLCPGRCLNQLAASRHARHIAALTATLDHRYAWTPPATGAPGLAALTDFKLSASRSGPVFTALADSAFAPALSALDLSACAGLGAGELAELARGDRFERLARLDLRSCNLGPVQLGSLTGAGPAPPVTDLNLTLNPLGDDGLAALLATPLVGRVRVLALHGTGLTDAGAAALARWPGAAQLTHLNLSNNSIGRAGIEALVRAPLAALQYLYLNVNPLNRDAGAVTLLRARFAAGPTRVVVTRTRATARLARATWFFLLY